MNEPIHVLMYCGADGVIPCFVGTRQECREFAASEPQRDFVLWAVFNSLDPVKIQEIEGKHEE